MKIKSKTAIILVALIFIGQLSSLAFPFLVKLDTFSNHHSIIGYEYGGNFFSVLLTLTCSILAISFSLFSKEHVLMLLANLGMLGAAYMVRWGVHYQGFIDHDYDSKSGTGYYLLVIFSIIEFLTLIAIFVVNHGLRKLFEE